MSTACRCDSACRTRAVTAQQVEDGSASLMDFTLAVRDQFGQGATTPSPLTLYAGCLLRQEGSVFRSGSTYLIQLRLDGRVFVHAKDMSLSGPGNSGPRFMARFVTHWESARPP